MSAPPTNSQTPDQTPEQKAAAIAKEKEEQDALPYRWTQQIGDLDVTIPVPAGTRGRDLIVDLKVKELKVSIKGKESIIEVNHHSTLMTSTTFCILFFLFFFSLLQGKFTSTCFTTYAIQSLYNGGTRRRN